VSRPLWINGHRQNPRKAQNELMNKSRPKWIALVFALVMIVLSVYLLARRFPEKSYVDTVRVYFRPGVSISPARLKEIASFVGGTVIYYDTAFNMTEIRVNLPPESIKDADALAYRLEREPDVEFATARPMTEELRRMVNTTNDQ